MPTILENIQNALLELGEAVPASVVGNTDQLGLQMLALMNRVAKNLSTEQDWQALETEYRFQTVVKTYTGNTTAGSATLTNLSSVAGLTTDFMVTGTGIPTDTFLTSVGTTTAVMSLPATATGTGVTFTFGQAKYDMPLGFNRISNKTQWNKSNTWVILGPKSAQEWQYIKSGFLATGPRQRFRIIGNKFVLWPMPTAVQNIGFEYISAQYALDSAGVPKGDFTLDNDTSLFPNVLLILGTKMKLYETRGLDSTAFAADYNRELSKYKAYDAGADTLNMAPKFSGILLTENNLPDTNFGS